ncbi:MAG: dockerin type I repeat-containing protein [Planctomycetes bacterium]|nr:dockerin type I repeat-containing protein [Planctomycetota bacterium]
MQIRAQPPYHMEGYGYAFYANTQSKRFEIEKYSGGTYVVIRSGGPTIQANEEWNMEGGAVGDTISLKAWRVGSPEPDEPQLVVTDPGGSHTGQLTLFALTYPTTGSAPLSICSDDLGFRPDQGGVEGAFQRGDTNADGVMNISDPVFGLRYLLSDGPEPSCLRTADVNDDGQIDLGDAIFGLNYLFASGAAPPFPLMECGLDSTADSLTCEEYAPCGG